MCISVTPKVFVLFLFKLCIVIVYTLKMCSSYFLQISRLFSHFRVLNLDIFPSKMLTVCLVCVICNSKSFHSLIFKLCIVIVPVLKMCTSIFCTYHDFFSFLRGVELRNSSHPKCLEDVWFVLSVSLTVFIP